MGSTDPKNIADQLESRLPLLSEKHGTTDESFTDGTGDTWHLKTGDDKFKEKTLKKSKKFNIRTGEKNGRFFAIYRENTPVEQKSTSAKKHTTININDFDPAWEFQTIADTEYYEDGVTSIDN